MKWIYYFKHKWINGDSSPLQSLYVRPLKVENNDTYAGKIIELDMITIDYVMSESFNDLRNENNIDEIFRTLKTANYHLIEQEVSDKEVYLLSFLIYVKEIQFTPITIIDWVKTIFDDIEIPYSSFEERTYDFFTETNTFLTSLVTGAQNMENVWGKEWWKTKE